MRLGLLLLAACGAESSSPPPTDQPPPAPKQDAAVVTPAKPSTSELDAWMPKDANAAWQGAWFTKIALRDAGTESFTGSYAALEITGTKARVWVPATQKEYELEVKIDRPCQITFTRDGNNYRKQFVIENGTVYSSGGGAGYRKGKTALVCMNDDVYILDDKGKCRRWKDHFGEWEIEDTTCTWTKRENGKDILVVDKPEMENKLDQRGTLLYNLFFHGAFPEETFGKAPVDHLKQADFAAAKAAAEKRWKETDIVEILKTAGGKPGETKTILDFYTTFKQDKAPLKGKPAELSGKVAEKIEKKEVDGKTEWVVLVVNPRMFAEKRFAIRCRSTKEVKRAVGATVTISGTVGEWWDDPALTACVVR